MRHALTALLPLLVLAACAPVPPDSTTLVSADRGNCDASFYGDLVGEPIEAARRIRPGVPVRILGPDDFVTRDFNPNRLTITTTQDDTVGRVFCG